MKWLVQKTNNEYIAYLSQTAGISLPMAQILINRGLKSPLEISQFFNPSLSAFLDPMDMPGMSDALACIALAMKHGVKVMVHGDYDVDGLTATAIVVEGLRALGLEVCYLIPNRFKDGYGFNGAAVDEAVRQAVGLIITVDCGITGFEAAESARANGIPLVITDHHEPIKSPDGANFTLPHAAAIINPKLHAWAGGQLSGAGVALKLMQALSARYPGRVDHEGCLDLAALGTVADSVPLLGENRIIARHGIEALQNTRRVGIRALRDASRIGSKPLKAGLLAFTIVPRINAPGRVADASSVVELLLAKSEPEAERYAAVLNEQNSLRQRIEEGVYKGALKMIEERGVGPALVLAAEGWHEGVVGIVASKLAERFKRPAFVLAIDGDMARGSSRGIPRCDLLEALHQCKDMLHSYGGHRQAAGLRMKVEMLERFEQAMSEIISKQMEDYCPTLNIDAAVELADINYRFVEEISQLEPFGYGNPEPVLGTRDLEAINPRVVGSNHLKMRLRSTGSVMDAIGFGMGDMCISIEENPSVDVAYTATVNEWEGGRTLQLNLKAIRERG